MKSVKDIETRLLRAFVAMIGKENVKFINPRYKWVNKAELTIDKIDSDGLLHICSFGYFDTLYDIEVSDILFKEEIDSDERKKERV